MERETGFNPDKESPKDFLVWWLSEAEQARIKPEQWLGVPIYIKDELKSLEGRPRDGRLWVPADIEVRQISWDDNHPNAKKIVADNAGGIVFHSSDIDALASLPGLITDTKLDTATENEE